VLFPARRAAPAHPHRRRRRDQRLRRARRLNDPAPDPAIRRPVEPAAHPERHPGLHTALTHSNQSGRRHTPRPSQLHHHHAELNGIGQGRARIDPSGRDAGAGEDPGQPDQRLRLLHRHATKDAAHAGETQQRLNLVAVWCEATVFTEAERAALELAEQGTRIADAAGGGTDEAWANAAKHYDDDQLTALVCLIALINTYNRMNVIV
jgi:hypothetical protein